MNAFLAIFTYFSYVFIIAMYTIKAIKYLKLPVHLRWELYPVVHEEKYSYGGSRLEELDWRLKPPQKHYLRGLGFLLKEYFTLGEYFKRNRGYWYSLYPWHVGFILIIVFHILCFLGALVMTSGVVVSPSSQNIIGSILYYLIMLTGVVGFFSGTAGSIGIFIKRVADIDLKTYASPINYFTYIFTLIVFLSGLYGWYFIDPTFSEYRGFWEGLVTLNYIHIDTGTAAHIILFNLFLIYLPFTRSMHYITRFFAFFLIRWDDEPNRKGSSLEHRLKVLLNQNISWSAPHIKAGKKWSEQ